MKPRRPFHIYQPFTLRKEVGQTVYVFGAGASASESDGVPTNATLLKSIIGRKEVVDRDARENILSFLDDLHYGVAFTPTFEEVFTIVELALDEERYFKGWSRTELVRLRTDLVLSAGQVLTEALQKRSEIHRSFVSNLFSREGVTYRNTSFISFNYDITLDKVLTADQERVGDIDYGCYFRSFDVNYEEKEAHWNPATLGGELFLLKPHGSFNWLWCPTCNFLRIHPGQNICLTAMKTKIPCAKCHGRLESLLIPPAWLKSYRNPNIVNIWVRAEFLLAQAEQVVFVGYSLSEADIQTRAVMKRATAGRKSKIVVVSNQEKGRQNDTYLRYRKFFGKVNWFEGGFANFANAPVHAIA